jgi:hypothetical protein
MSTLKQRSKTVRRSVALPSQLVAEVTGAAPPDLKNNLNRLVIVALDEYVRKRREQAFEEAMARMAADPAIRRENRAIAKEFRAADSDGL